MTLYLFEIVGGMIELDADCRERAAAVFEDLIEPLANHGTIGWYGPATEGEFAARSSRTEIERLRSALKLAVLNGAFDDHPDRDEVDALLGTDETEPK